MAKPSGSSPFETWNGATSCSRVTGGCAGAAALGSAAACAAEEHAESPNPAARHRATPALLRTVNARCFFILSPADETPVAKDHGASHSKEKAARGTVTRDTKSSIDA